MDVLRRYLHTIRVHNLSGTINKVECIYSSDTVDSASGIFVSLSNFLCFGEKYAHQYAEKSGNPVFLNIQRKKQQVKDYDCATRPKKARFENDALDEDNFVISTEWVITYEVVVLPHIRLAYPQSEFPLQVKEAVESILTAKDFHKPETKILNLQVEQRPISKYSDDLIQQNAGKIVAMSGWVCEHKGCNLTNNLWLNLTDGTVLCGRRFFDGSGGNEHAAEHYKQTKYPLVVKLSTIRADGTADIFSYPENIMVEDNKLKEHLAHFGIDIAQMSKTEPTLMELQYDIDELVDFDICLCFTQNDEPL